MADNEQLPISLETIDEARALLGGSESERRVLGGGVRPEVMRGADGWKYWWREVPMDGNRVKVCEAFGPFTI